MSFLAQQGIINKRGFFSGIPVQSFLPTNIPSLALWVSADYGVIEGDIEFINSITISGCDPSTSNGTYTRTIGYHTTFYNGDSYIQWNGGADWDLFDADLGDVSFSNSNDLDEGAWYVSNGVSFGSASNGTGLFTSIAEVLDQSGNSNNLIYSAGNPFVENNIINGKPAFSFFDGSRLQGTDISTAKTIYAVIRLGDVEPFGYMNILESSGGGLYTSINASEWGSYFSDFNGSGEVLQLNTEYIISTISDDGVDYKFRSNGSQIKAGSDGSGFLGRNTLFFGNDSSGGQPSNCHVAEVLVYDTAISDADAQKLENYLNNKYAVY